MVIVISDTCTHVRGVLLPRVQRCRGGVKLPQSFQLSLVQQSCARGRTSAVRQRPSRHVGKWEPGTRLGRERRRRQPVETCTHTARRQQSDRGARGSVGGRGEGESCGPAGTRRGYGVQMSGWLARAHLAPLSSSCCIHLLYASVKLVDRELASWPARLSHRLVSHSVVVVANVTLSPC